MIRLLRRALCLQGQPPCKLPTIHQEVDLHPEFSKCVRTRKVLSEAARMSQQIEHGTWSWSCDRAKQACFVIDWLQILISAYFSIVVQRVKSPGL